MSHWYKSFKGSDGSINTFEWSLNDEIFTNVLSLIVMFFAVLLFALILPPLAMLVYPSSVKRHKLQSIIVGVVAGTYFLIDYIMGWFFWAVFHNFESFYPFILILNTSLLIIFILLYFYEGWLDEKFSKVPAYGLLFFITLILVLKFILFPVLRPVIDNIGYVEKNVDNVEVVDGELNC